MAGGLTSFLMRLQRRGTLGAAGQSFLGANFNPHMRELSLRNAQDFDQNSIAATQALGAPAGSIAERNNPFKYGSIAGRFNPTFGDRDNRNAFDSLNDATNSDNAGMMRRTLYQGISALGGNDDGFS